MWQRVSKRGVVCPKALGMNLLIFIPGYADAWVIRSFSMSRPLYSAFASALSSTSRIFWAALTGYLPAYAFCSPRLCAAFFLCLWKGIGFFFWMTWLRRFLALSSFIPFMVLQISVADLGDTLSSRPLAFAVFSGSSSSVEYPHFGMVGFSPFCNEQKGWELICFFM